MKQRLALLAVLSAVLFTAGCAWMMPDADPLVVYRRQGVGKNGSLLIGLWQLTVDVNGKITAVANPGNVLSTVPRVEMASNEFMTELRSALGSDEMQSLRPEQLLESSRNIKGPEYTYTLIHNGRVLQTVSGAVPPGMIRTLRLLDQKLQLMDSQATAPGVDQFSTIQQPTPTPIATVTLPRPTSTLPRPTPSMARTSPTVLTPTKPPTHLTPTPRR